MSIFGKIMEKLGMGRNKPAPDIRPLNPRPTSGAGGGGGLGSPGTPVGTPAAPKPTPMTEVDVVAKLDTMAAASAQKLNWRTSIVDLMKLLGMDSSLDERRELATELGCPAEKMADSAQMNMWLHAKVLRKLAENGGNIPADMLD